MARNDQWREKTIFPDPFPVSRETPLAGTAAGGDVVTDLDDEPRAPGLVKAVVIPVSVSLAMVAIATAALFVSRGLLELLNLVSIVYLLPVLIAAARWGLVPAVVAAVAGAAPAVCFFYPPLYSFEIGDTQNVADLVIFLIVAFVTSHFTVRLRRE